MTFPISTAWAEIKQWIEIVMGNEVDKATSEPLAMGRQKFHCLVGLGISWVNVKINV